MNESFDACGVFNTHFKNKSNPIVKQVLNLLEVVDISVTIMEPTRRMSIIDNILTNDNESKTLKGILNPMISDRDVFFIVRNR